MSISQLDKASKTAILNCMGAKTGEKLLIITDNIKKTIGYSLYKTALELGFESLYIETPPNEIDGQEPPGYIAELMKSFDVVLCPTTKSLTHTNARREASAMGVRIATFPGITKEIMIRGLNADYNKIADLTLKLKEIFERTKNVRVTTKTGTDIIMEITGRTAYASKGLFHNKGESGNLPTGETFAAPLEGTSNGIFIVDGSMSGLGVMKNSKVYIKVENGFAIDIRGGVKAKKLNEILDKYGKEARNIAEFGIGTNHKAKISGVVLEDEKVLGTVHIALGNNKSMGGGVGVPIHLDGIIIKPDVFFDDRMIMKNGKLLI